MGRKTTRCQFHKLLSSQRCSDGNVFCFDFKCNDIVRSQFFSLSGMHFSQDLVYKLILLPPMPIKQPWRLHVNKPDESYKQLMWMVNQVWSVHITITAKKQNKAGCMHILLSMNHLGSFSMHRYHLTRRNSHHKDKTVVRLSYLYDENPHTDKDSILQRGLVSYPSLLSMCRVQPWCLCQHTDTLYVSCGIFVVHNICIHCLQTTPPSHESWGSFVSCGSQILWVT